ncbi:MAG: phosphatase PAP2 family protein [Alphaproteobacteria bacterium]|nr:phosphatase PAP2 family protein [Alphaproteobacteria bacterium]
MKKIYLILFIFSFLINSACQAEVSSFLTKDQIPTASEFLPSPPETTDAAFYNDWYRYEWGKSVRNTERGKQAIEDAAHSLEYFYKIYSEPFGLIISKENTPEISALLERVLATSVLCKDKAKSQFMRTRPFVQFNEPTPVPNDEEVLKNNSSYPSGHTTMGWGIALVLAEINPDRQNEILKRAFEYGESRVIVGFHYQSDVDHARILTSVLINRLHGNDDFVKQLQKAKEEFFLKKASDNKK